MLRDLQLIVWGGKEAAKVSLQLHACLMSIVQIITENFASAPPDGDVLCWKTGRRWQSGGERG